jgi:capsular polysaccharide transport system permease protein
MPNDESVPVLKQEPRALQKGDGRPQVPATQIEAPALNPLAWAKEAVQIDIVMSTRRRRNAFLRRLLVFVGLPTLLAAGYAFLYATPRYVSEFQLTYQTSGQAGAPSVAAAGAAQSNAMASMLGLGAGTVDMSRVIASYLTSADLLAKVDAKVHLRGHYSDPRVDWFDRLPAQASQEDFLAYFQKRITVDALMGGYVIVDVEAFDRETAVKAAQAMADAADEMVQEMSNRALNDEVRSAEQELAHTQDRLLQATLEVTKFRNEHHNFDPQAAATQLGTVVAGLEAQLAGYRAALASARNFVNDQAPAVKSLRAQIAATEQQIALEQDRLAHMPKSGEPGSGPRPEPYSQTVADYVRLTVEQQFATDAYVAAKQALDIARTSAASRQKYVESFVPPNTPEESTAPDPTKIIAGTFVVVLLLYMIGSLLVGAFRDEAGV